MNLPPLPVPGDARTDFGTSGDAPDKLNQARTAPLSESHPDVPKQQGAHREHQRETIQEIHEERREKDSTYKDQIRQESAQFKKRTGLSGLVEAERLHHAHERLADSLARGFRTGIFQGAPSHDKTSHPSLWGDQKEQLLTVEPGARLFDQLARGIPFRSELWAVTANPDLLAYNHGRKGVFTDARRKLRLAPTGMDARGMIKPLLEPILLEDSNVRQTQMEYLEGHGDAALHQQMHESNNVWARIRSGERAKVKRLMKHTKKVVQEWVERDHSHKPLSVTNAEAERQESRKIVHPHPEPLPFELPPGGQAPPREVKQKIEDYHQAKMLDDEAVNLVSGQGLSTTAVAAPEKPGGGDLVVEQVRVDQETKTIMDQGKRHRTDQQDIIQQREEDVDVQILLNQEPKRQKKEKQGKSDNLPKSDRPWPFTKALTEFKRFIAKEKGKKRVSASDAQEMCQESSAMRERLPNPSLKAMACAVAELFRNNPDLKGIPTRSSPKYAELKALYEKHKAQGAAPAAASAPVQPNAPVGGVGGGGLGMLEQATAAPLMTQ